MTHAKSKWTTALAACFVAVLLITMFTTGVFATGTDTASDSYEIEAYDENDTDDDNDEPDQQFRRVEGFSQLYEVRNADGTAQTPPRFVWGHIAMAERYIFEVTRFNNVHYIQMLDTGVFIPIRGGSPLDTIDFANGAIWAGPGGVLGGADNVALTLEGNRFYEVIRDGAEDVWRAITMRVPNWPPTPASGTQGNDTEENSSNQESSSSSSSSSSNPPPPNIPQTGFNLNTSAVVAAVILAMGAGYFGISYIKSKQDD